MPSRQATTSRSSPSTKCRPTPGVGGVAAREAVADEPVVDGPAALLVVVVRAEAAAEETEALHRRQLRAERVGDAVLEPADAAGARAREHDAPLPGAAEDRVEAVRAPDREHVGRVAAADPDDVVLEHERLEVVRRPREELEPAELGLPGEAVVRAERGRGVLRARGAHVEDARPLAAGQADEEVGEAVAEEAAADRDDMCGFSAYGHREVRR